MPRPQTLDADPPRGPDARAAAEAAGTPAGGSLTAPTGSIGEASQSTPAAPSGPGAYAAPTSPHASVGRYLSRQRRLRGISLDELASLTRIPARSLERLESGRFDGESDGFVRGFVRTVAEALGLDPEEAISRLLVEVPPDEPGPRAGPRPARVAVAVAVIGALAVALALGRAVWTWASSPTSSPDVVYRHDPVRALADAVRAQGDVEDPPPPRAGGRDRPPPRSELARP